MDYMLEHNSKRMDAPGFPKRILCLGWGWGYYLYCKEAKPFCVISTVRHMMAALLSFIFRKTIWFRVDFFEVVDFLFYFFFNHLLLLDEVTL